MARQTMRGLSTLALLAVLPLAVGGCSYINGELDQLRPDTKQLRQARPQTDAKPVKRVAHTERKHAAPPPGAHRSGERQIEPRTAIPLAPRPAESETKPAPAPASEPPAQAPRSPAPAVVPAPAPLPPVPAPAAPAPPSNIPPRVINPSTPAPPVAPPPAAPQPEPLPTEPGPPPPRPEPQPAPPNRAHITPSRQSGGGMLLAVRPEPPARIAPAHPAPEPIVLSPQGNSSSNETLSKSQVAARLDLARRLLQRGKVVEARIALQTIARNFPAAGLHELARTYDPYYLGQLPRIDDGSEPRTAASLYQDAINHGATSAGNDLDRLRASYPSLR